MRALLLLLLVMPLLAVDKRLAWDGNTNEVVSGYKLSWGSISGSYSNSIETTNTTAVASNLPVGATYLAVQAIRDGVESDYSDELVFTNSATNRFMVILGTGIETQAPAINEILKAKGWEVLNKIDRTWFILGEDVTSRALAEELSRHPLVGGKIKIVIKINPDGTMTYWGNASKETWIWMAKFWGKSG
jgi:hypothetical protein